MAWNGPVIKEVEDDHFKEWARRSLIEKYVINRDGELDGLDGALGELATLALYNGAKKFGEPLLMTFIHSLQRAFEKEHGVLSING